MENKKRWIIFSLCLFLSIIITIFVINSRITALDNWFYSGLMNYQNNFLTFYFENITHLGSFIYILIFSGLIIIWSFLKKNQLRYYLLLMIFITALFNQTLKFIFARPRPEVLDLIVETGYSYPSGHTMMAVSFYGFLICLVYRTKLNIIIKWMSYILLTVIIISVSISRIYLGVHYFSDIITGSLLSIAILIFITELMKRKNYEN